MIIINPNCYKTKISNKWGQNFRFAQRIDHLENQVIKIETGYYDEQTQKAENQNKKRKGDNQPLKPIEESPVLIDIVNQIKTFKEQQKKFVQEVNQFRAEQQNKTDERNNLQNQVADFYDNKIDPVEGKLSDLRTNGLENGHGNFEGVKKIYSQLKKELDEAKPPIEELKNEWHIESIVFRRVFKSIRVIVIMNMDKEKILLLKEEYEKGSSVKNISKKI